MSRLYVPSATDICIPLQGGSIESYQHRHPHGGAERRVHGIKLA